MDCVSSHSNSRILTGFVHSNAIPTKDTVNSGIFAEHFFNINPTNAPISDLVDAKFFFSEFHNPVINSDQKYFMIGLTGSEDGKNKREKMDVVIVIDRSGSMNMGLYDTNQDQNESQRKTKMELTKESTKELFEVFDDDEEIGIIAFDNVVEVIEDLKKKSQINKQTLFDSLNKIQARGGTNMEIGMAKAIQMLLGSPNQDRKKRIIFITDDCPNAGVGSDGLKGMAEEAYRNSNKTIGITYVGVGLSFNAAVSEKLSKVHGTTIFSVNSSRELKETLVDDFNYLVSPIAFDVSVLFESNGLGIDFVYGCDDDAAKSEELLHFRTMTASSINEKGIKGCAVLIKLKEIQKLTSQTSDSAKVTIIYQPAQGSEIRKKVFEASLSNNIPSLSSSSSSPSSSSSSPSSLFSSQQVAIQKAIALAVYYDTLKDVLPSTYSISFKDSEKEKLRKLKEFLEQLPAEIRGDFSKEQSLVKKLVLME